MVIKIAGECDVLDDASSICSCTVDDDQKEHNKASMRKDKYPVIKSHMCLRFSPNEDPSL